APLVVIMGGRHKGSPYTPLASRLGRTRTVLAIGEAAPLIERELGMVVPVERLDTLDRAVARARAVARPGDVVLLAPACSSYDQFESFEQRGARFRELVSRTNAVAPAREP
ncbi:MAG: UDP-N-acetylmuramoyl-L-alanine--D-glutamate ligase, partial [Gemmatimonadota bacterium]